MKIAVKNIDKVADESVLLALSESSLNDLDKRYNEDNGLLYRYFKKSTVWDVQPADASSSKGGWIKSTDISVIAYNVDDNYDFATNSATDISGIVNWDNFFKNQISVDDFRSSVKALVDIKTFALCTPSEQLVAVEWYLVDKTDRDTVLSDSDQLLYAERLESMLMIDSGNRSLQSHSSRIKDGDVYSTSCPEIFGLTEVTHKDHTTINYCLELKPGIKLHKEEVFLKEGLIDIVTYYHNYVDENNKGTEILRVEHQWTVDTAEAIPAARSVQKRTKTRKWKTMDGNYHSLEKSTQKIYDTEKKVNEEGVRRRVNVRTMVQTGVVTILVLTGTSPNTNDAIDKLISAFGTYSESMATYMVSGKGNIYDDLTNDTTYTWFDTVIGTTAQGALGLPAGWDVKTIIDYMIDKLKGLI